MSDYVTWWVNPKGATLNLARLHPKLKRIELAQRPRAWLATVIIGRSDFSSTGANLLEALANLLNQDELLEELGRGWER